MPIKGVNPWSACFDLPINSNRFSAAITAFFIDKQHT